MIHAQSHSRQGDRDACAFLLDTPRLEFAADHPA
jgi:hypothetical protein